MDHIYVYTQTAQHKQIAQLDAESLDLLKNTFHIFGHTYSELRQDNGLFVFLTPSPLTDAMRQRIIQQIEPNLPLLSPGTRIWLEGGDGPVVIIAGN